MRAELALGDPEAAPSSTKDLISQQIPCLGLAVQGTGDPL